MTGKTSILAAALVIPFLLMAGVSSIITNQIASKTGLVRPLFLLGLAILPVGMVCRESFIIYQILLYFIQGMMSTLDAKSSIGKVVGYTLICGCGFGSVNFVVSCLLTRL